MCVCVCVCVCVWVKVRERERERRIFKFQAYLHYTHSASPNHLATCRLHRFIEKIFRKTFTFCSWWDSMDYIHFDKDSDWIKMQEAWWRFLVTLDQLWSFAKLKYFLRQLWYVLLHFNRLKLKKVRLAERGFDPRTSGLWAQHASTAPLCYFFHLGNNLIDIKVVF